MGYGELGNVQNLLELEDSKVLRIEDDLMLAIKLSDDRKYVFVQLMSEIGANDIEKIETEEITSSSKDVKEILMLSKAEFERRHGDSVLGFRMDGCVYLINEFE